MSSPPPRPRCDDLLPSPSNPRYRIAHIGFRPPGGRQHNADKDKRGRRYDAVGVCNGIVNAGAACDVIEYDPTRIDEMAGTLSAYDALVVRINPGQLSCPGVRDGAQDDFDALMNRFIAEGKLVWNSPAVQKTMGAKNALVRIRDISCGLSDTFTYDNKEELCEGFLKTAAFRPRVLKQNRGSHGEGIWLCWLEGKEYCETFGEKTLELNDRLKLMEMNDNHVEHHTVGEFLEFCVNGPTPEAGTWRSDFPGRYLRGGDVGHIVDQRLLPRITEGEVRMLMVTDTLFQIIRKKPNGGGFSAVGGNNDPTFFPPDAPEFAELKRKFIERDVPELLEVMGIKDQPLPLIWTADFIPCDGDQEGTTKFVVGEFNCTCVGISNLFGACGAEKDMSDVSDEDYARAMELCDLIGRKAVETLDEAASARAAAAAAGKTEGRGGDGA